MEYIFKLELAKQAAAERATLRFIYPGTPAFELIMACVEEGLKAAFEEEKVA